MQAIISFINALPTFVWAIVGLFKAFLLGTVVMVFWWRICNWLTDGLLNDVHLGAVNWLRTLVR